MMNKIWLLQHVVEVLEKVPCEWFWLFYLAGNSGINLPGRDTKDHLTGLGAVFVGKMSL